MRLIDGRALSQQLCTHVHQEVATLPSTPCLAVIYVGDDPATQVYVGRKRDMAMALGMESRVMHFPAIVTFQELYETISSLNQDAKVRGILLQMPLPPHLDRFALLEAIAPHKDVDGLTSQNLGLLAAGHPRFVPCTPQGCLRIIDHVGYDVIGKTVLMIGRSNIVGLPLSLLLGQRGATVTVAHSQTVHLDQLTAQADMIISAVGKPDLVKTIKPGAFIIDVGISRVEEDGLCRLAGDVALSVQATAGYLTPVPGGVGPMTVACLMYNTLQACKATL